MAETTKRTSTRRRRSRPASNRRTSLRVPLINREITPPDSVTLPLLHVDVHLPPPDHAVYYAGIGALVALELIEWPVALVIAVGHEIAQRSHNRALKGAGEAAESA